MLVKNSVFTFISHIYLVTANKMHLKIGHQLEGIACSTMILNMVTITKCLQLIVWTACINNVGNMEIFYWKLIEHED